MNTRNGTAMKTPAPKTPLEIARHFVTQAHRERVRLRRRRLGQPAPATRPAAAPDRAGAAMLVVAGADGSDAAVRALRWAAREARAHHGRLTVCWLGPVPAAGSSEPGSAQGAFDKIEDDLLTVIAEETPELAADLRMAPAVLGVRARELTELSHRADLLVLARPNERYLSRWFATGIVRRLIGRAGCPVVLVP